MTITDDQCAQSAIRNPQSEISFPNPSLGAWCGHAASLAFYRFGICTRDGHFSRLNPLDLRPMSYVMVDIESDGPIPGDYSMICFGAIIVEPSLSRIFYGQLRPIS